MMGIGLNSGEAIVGNVGSEKRAKYTAVGTTINLAARVESCTVGGQVLLSPHTYERIRDLADVGVAIPVEVKGVREPLLLYELRGLAGRYARHLPETDGAGAEDAVDLALTCWVIEGKTVQPEPLVGRVVRLASRRLAARLPVRLAPLANVRLRLRLPALDQESGEIYGKVVAISPADGEWLASIAFTSVDAADQQALEGLLRGPAATT
jgi:adenylate cyclase